MRIIISRYLTFQYSQYDSKLSQIAPRLCASAVTKMKYTYTSYNLMVIESNNIPMQWNIMAAISTWLFLAGFIFLPGTFTSLQSIQSQTRTGNIVKSFTASNIVLLVFSIIFCVIAASIIGALWLRYHYNYIWLLHRLLQ